MAGSLVRRLGQMLVTLFLIVTAAFFLIHAQPGDHSSFYALHPSLPPASPSWKHPLGTDPLGRGVLSQSMANTASELMPGVNAALFAVTVGTAAAAISA